MFNEWFVKNTSKKIRAVWQAKGKSGERLAEIPPYGYRKDPEDSKQIVVNEENAAVVRRIFRLSVEGYGPAQIARTLNGEHLLNPSSYKYEHGILSKARPCKDAYFWNTTTVHKILDAPEYMGETINSKTWSKSYKDSRPRLNPPDKQLVFEHTHPAIIDPETWDYCPQYAPAQAPRPSLWQSRLILRRGLLRRLREQIVLLYTGNQEQMGNALSILYIHTFHHKVVAPNLADGFFA